MSFKLRTNLTWSQCFHSYLDKYLPLHYKISTMDTSHTYIVTFHISHVNLQAHAINATLQLVKVHKTKSHFVCGSQWNISINLMHTSQYSTTKQFILCIFGKAPQFFHRNPWQCKFHQKIQKRKGMGTRR